MLVCRIVFCCLFLIDLRSYKKLVNNFTSKWAEKRRKVLVHHSGSNGLETGFAQPTNAPSSTLLQGPLADVSVPVFKSLSLSLSLSVLTAACVCVTQQVLHATKLSLQRLPRRRRQIHSRRLRSAREIGYVQRKGTMRPTRVCAAHTPLSNFQLGILLFQLLILDLCLTTLAARSTVYL